MKPKPIKYAKTTQATKVKTRATRKGFTYYDPVSRMSVTRMTEARLKRFLKRLELQDAMDIANNLPD